MHILEEPKKNMPIWVVELSKVPIYCWPFKTCLLTCIETPSLRELNLLLGVVVVGVSFNPVSESSDENDCGS